MWPAIYVVAGLGLLVSIRRPNAVWGGTTIGLLSGLAWGFVAGERTAYLLRGAAVGAAAGAVYELLTHLPKVRVRVDVRANVAPMGLDRNKRLVPGSPGYDALVKPLSEPAATTDAERKAS